VEEAEDGEDVFDLLAVVEADSADDPVRDVADAERLLQDAALGCRPVHHGERVSAATRLFHQSPDLGNDPVRLVVGVGRFVDDDRRSLVVFCPKPAVDALRVGADDLVGGFDDPLGRAVIELEVDQLRVRVVLLEVENVADVGLAPAVDRLVGIADDEEVAVLGGEGGDKDVLDAVRVLVLVDQDVAEALLVSVEESRHLVEELDRQSEEVVKVDGVCLAQQALVRGVGARDDLVVVRLGLVGDLLWRQKHALGRRDPG
jgi:hypothetical protein